MTRCYFLLTHYLGRDCGSYSDVSTYRYHFHRLTAACSACCHCRRHSHCSASGYAGHCSTTEYRIPSHGCCYDRHCLHGHRQSRYGDDLLSCGDVLVEISHQCWQLPDHVAYEGQRWLARTRSGTRSLSLIHVMN